MPCLKHRCKTTGEEWDCHTEPCHYDVERDCMYHSAKSRNILDDDKVRFLISLEGYSCSTGIRELKALAQKMGVKAYVF